MECNILYMYIALGSVQYVYNALGTSAISRYCTQKSGFWLCFEPSFDAKIDEARTCAINVVG